MRRGSLSAVVEAAALRFLVLQEITGNAQPVIVLGDLNNAARAVTTDVIMGDSHSRFWPRDPEDTKAYWDRLLYLAYELTVRRTGRDVSYTHILNGHYENLDHILVSQESTSVIRNASRKW